MAEGGREVRGGGEAHVGGDLLDGMVRVLEPERDLVEPQAHGLLLNG